MAGDQGRGGAEHAEPGVWGLTPQAAEDHEGSPTATSHHQDDPEESHANEASGLSLMGGSAPLQRQLTNQHNN